MLGFDTASYQGKHHKHLLCAGGVKVEIINFSMFRHHHSIGRILLNLGLSATTTKLYLHAMFSVEE